MYYLSYLIKCIMYIKDKLSVIERVCLRKNTQRNMFFFFFFFFPKFTFSAKMRHVENLIFSNITYKEGRFYQKRSELHFRCESGRKGDKRYPNWHYL